METPEFNVKSIEHELITSYFAKPENRGDATDYLTSAEILGRIEMGAKQVLSPKKIGEALQELGYEKWQKTINSQTKWVFSVIDKKSKYDKKAKPCSFRKLSFTEIAALKENDQIGYVDKKNRLHWSRVNNVIELDGISYLIFIKNRIVSHFPAFHELYKEQYVYGVLNTDQNYIFIDTLEI
jgi:hypothetical protein